MIKKRPSTKTRNQTPAAKYLTSKALLSEDRHQGSGYCEST